MVLTYHQVRLKLLPGCFQYSTTDDILFVTGRPVMRVVAFHLEAVGEDWDGTIRPLQDLGS